MLYASANLIHGITQSTVIWDFFSFYLISMELGLNICSISFRIESNQKFRFNIAVVDTTRIDFSTVFCIQKASESKLDRIELKKWSHRLHKLCSSIDFYCTVFSVQYLIFWIYYEKLVTVQCTVYTSTIQSHIVRLTNQ